MRLSDYMRQQAADEFNSIRERELSAFVDKHGGKLPGETLEEAVRRCRERETQYEQSLARLKEVAARVPPIPHRASSDPTSPDAATQRTATQRKG